MSGESSTFIEEFREFMEWARRSKPPSWTEGHADVIRAYLQANQRVAFQIFSLMPRLARLQGADPFLSVWCTGFLLGIEFTRRRNELAELERIVKADG